MEWKSGPDTFFVMVAFPPFNFFFRLSLSDMPWIRNSGGDHTSRTGHARTLETCTLYIVPFLSLVDLQDAAHAHMDGTRFFYP